MRTPEGGITHVGSIRGERPHLLVRMTCTIQFLVSRRHSWGQNSARYLITNYPSQMFPKIRSVLPQDISNTSFVSMHASSTETEALETLFKDKLVEIIYRYIIGGEKVFLCYLEIIDAIIRSWYRSWRLSRSPLPRSLLDIMTLSQMLQKGESRTMSRQKVELELSMAPLLGRASGKLKSELEHTDGNDDDIILPQN